MNETSVAPQVPRPLGRNRLTLYGGLGTGAYLLFLLGYTWSQWEPLLELKPDAFANCLAGAFAPLAFLWLVLGFLQQGVELRHSATALYLQGEELRNSVEQQKRLVEVSREQLDAERQERERAEQAAAKAAQPKLILAGGGGTYDGSGAQTLRRRVDNGGPTCTSVRVFADGQLKGERSVLEVGHSIEFQFHYPADSEILPVPVDVHYVDLRGFEQEQRFIIDLEPTGAPQGRPTLGKARPIP